MEISYYKKRFYRNDIQGIRAVSAFLIIIHHIWTHKVSGGVDAFFVISGFLMGSILLREYADRGRISLFSFYARVFKRILPTAFLVLFLTALFTLFIVPVPLWKFGINEFIASAIQIENWELFRTSVDYLDRENPQSQFQQYWALSMQAQFYLVLPLVFLFGLVVLKKLTPIYALFLCCIFIFLGSLYFSITKTNLSPNQSYFNTFMRFWEFFLGILVAIVYPFFKLEKIPKIIVNFIVSVSLLIFLTFGFWVPSTLNFPGWIALVPASSIAIFILFAKNPQSKGVGKILENRYISSIGKFSFTLYLCHWPILIFYQHYLNRSQLTLLEGISVIILAVAISTLIYYLFERPLQNKMKGLKVLPSLIICSVLVLTFTSVGLYARQYFIDIADLRNNNEVASSDVFDGTNFGPVNFNYWLTIDYDRAHAIDNCLGKVCYYGEKESEKVVVLLGASHAAHYQPLFESMAYRYGFKLVTVLSHSDSFNTVKAINPDFLISSGTVTSEPGNIKKEYVIEEYNEIWDFLSKAGTPILLVRDTPRFNFYQNGCLWEKSTSGLECSVNRSDIYSGSNPLDVVEGAGMYSVDFSDLVCDENNCFAEINGLPIYYDKHHFTNRFVLSNAAKMLNEIKTQAPSFYNLLVS